MREATLRLPDQLKFEAEVEAKTSKPTSLQGKDKVQRTRTQKLSKIEKILCWELKS